MDKNMNNSNNLSTTDKTKKDINRQIDEELRKGQSISQGNLTTDPAGGNIASDIFAAASNAAKNASQKIEDKYDFGPKGMPSRNFGKQTPAEQAQQAQSSLISNPLDRQQNSWNDQRAHNEAVPEGLADARTVGNIENRAQKDAFANTNPETKEVAYGYNKYRTSSDSLQNMGQIVEDTVKSGYEQSDAKQGYNRLRHGYSLAGGTLIGNALSGSTKYKANNDFYNYGSLNGGFSGFGSDRTINKMYVNEIENRIAISGAGPDAFIGRANTGNLQRDFATQKARIVHQLEAKKINARTLNAKDIANAVKSGELNGIKLDADTRLALFEYHNLIKMEPGISGRGGLKAGLTDQTKLLIKESIKDSDAYTGIRTATSSVKAGKAAVKATRVGSSLAVSTAASAIAGAGNVSAKVVEKYSTRKFGKTGDVKWKVRSEAAKNASIKITDGKNKVKYTARDYRKGGITGMAKKGIEKTKLGRGISDLKDKFYGSRLISRLNGMKAKLLGSKPLRAVATPFKGMKFAGLFLKKAKLYVFGTIGIFAFVAILMIYMVNAFTPSISDWNPFTVENTMAAGGTLSGVPMKDFSIATDAMDFVKKYKDAYETNLYNYTPGSQEAEKGLLPTWGLYDYLPENIGFGSDKKWQSVNEAPTAYEEDAESITKDKDDIPGDEEEDKSGYDLEQYWGSKTFDYKTKTEWITDYYSYPDGESDIKEKYIGDITLYSTAGILGKGNTLGSFYGRQLGDWVFVDHTVETNSHGDPVDVYTYKLVEMLDEGSEAYTERPSRAMEYTEYDFNKVYTGAEFAEYYTNDSYKNVLRLNEDDDGHLSKSTQDELIIDKLYDFKNDEYGFYTYQIGRKKTWGDYYAAHFGGNYDKWNYKGTMQTRSPENLSEDADHGEYTRDNEIIKDSNYEMMPFFEGDLFKNLLAMSTGITDNIQECPKFYEDYMLNLYKKIAQADYSTLDYDERKNYTPDERNVFLCTYPAGKSGMSVFSPKLVKSGAGEFEENHPEAYVYCPGHPDAAITIDVAGPVSKCEDKEDVEISYSWISKGLLELRYWDCGIQDMMRLDTEKNKLDDTCKKVDNMWVHNVEHHNEESYGIAQGDEGMAFYAYENPYQESLHYRIWDGVVEESGEYRGWFAPSGSLTNEHCIALEYSEFGTDDWEMIFTDYEFPDEYGYFLTSIEDILNGAEFLTPEIKEEYMKIRGEYLFDDEFEWPEGSYSLEDFMNFYIYQIDIQNKSKQSGLCYFSSCVMVAQYLTGRQLSQDTIAQLAKQWCKTDGTFYDKSSFLSYFGLKKCGGDIAWNPSAIQEQLAAGKPVIGHVKKGVVGGKGYWGSGHYFVITGITDDGRYKIADPGSKYSYKSERYMTQEEVDAWQSASFRIIE